MNGILSLIIVGGSIFFVMLYFVIRMAVEDGTINALKKYDSMKNKQNENQDGHV